MNELINSFLSCLPLFRIYCFALFFATLYSLPFFSRFLNIVFTSPPNVLSEDSFSILPPSPIALNNAPTAVPVAILTTAPAALILFSLMSDFTSRAASTAPDTAPHTMLAGPLSVEINAQSIAQFYALNATSPKLSPLAIESIAPRTPPTIAPTITVGRSPPSSLLLTGALLQYAK